MASGKCSVNFCDINMHLLKNRGFLEITFLIVQKIRPGGKVIYYSIGRISLQIPEDAQPSSFLLTGNGW
jgi:hypothetical protein